MTYTLWHGDCLEEMSRIEDGSVDMICADLPYGTTACKWDVVIPFEPLWKHYKRVIKKRGAIVLFGSEPFSSLLRLSNLDWYKYDWTWDKVTTTGFFNAKFAPLRVTENICIFYRERPTYNPILEDKLKKHIRKNNIERKHNTTVFGTNSSYKLNEFRIIPVDKNYPKNLIRISNSDHYKNKYGTTQKPVALLSYLIKTYTNEGDTILDNTCGSGSTLEAAMRNNRHSIGIEKDAHYFSVASDRLARVAAELRGELNHLPMFADNAQLP